MIAKSKLPLKINCVCTQPVQCGCDPAVEASFDVSSLSTSAVNFEFSTRNQTAIALATVAILLLLAIIAALFFKWGKHAQRKATRRSARFDQTWQDARDMFSPVNRKSFCLTDFFSKLEKISSSNKTLKF